MGSQFTTNIGATTVVDNIFGGVLELVMLHELPSMHAQNDSRFQVLRGYVASSNINRHIACAIRRQEPNVLVQ